MTATANVDARATPEHDRAVVIERIQAAAYATGAACDVHPECTVPAGVAGPVTVMLRGPARVLVTGTYTEISRVRDLLPGDVSRRAEVVLGTTSASLRWVL